jgi:hypothetical protein
LLYRQYVKYSANDNPFFCEEIANRGSYALYNR